ncbi:MAG: (Fe-S)-binding protein, partial [Desulfobulbaceae bacterium]|nr:(Fe-S)-binding protein [Desulfobulbaceae bacterium]
MTHIRSPLTIYKILPQTNCGLCLLPSCLAFAAAVVAERKKLRDCPSLSAEQMLKFSIECPRIGAMDDDQAEFMLKLKEKMATVNLVQIAPLIGGTMLGERIVINSLGKDFIIDRHGDITSECH